MRRVLTGCLIWLFSLTATGQQEPLDQTIPAATRWTIDAAGPTQRTAIRSVVLLTCQSEKGTGFLLKNGVVVTNWHVVKECNASQVLGGLSSGAPIRFGKMAQDEDADLALLRPTVPMTGGLDLGPDQEPTLGTAVSTWGFPLAYNGPAPLLSVGYVAGYTADESNGRSVKHLVVNGAFNPGNSGGPLFRSNDDKVIGIVVAKYHLYPPFVKQAIEAMSKIRSGAVYSATDDQGRPIKLVEGQVVAMVLDQFYKTTQVMIGQAISVSELKGLLKSKEKELR
jgi:hypothetical protein